MSTKRKQPNKIAQPVAKRSAKHPLKTNVNESETAVSVPELPKAQDGGPKEQVIEISSDSASSEYDSSDEEQDATAGQQSGNPTQSEAKTALPTPQDGDGDGDVDMVEANAHHDTESDQEPTQPTLGELARAHEPIDVPSAITAQSSSLTTQGRSLAPPSLASLGTVLTQALRTDDTDLLESCLHTTDLQTIRNTIQRLDSTLASTLLTKLAARMHRRPGRAGNLMTWVQWTLISHGGALATQPSLVKRLSELHRVLDERSRGLASLLALKGKLDLLEAQMQLRRSMQQHNDPDSEEEEEGVIYVEGEDSDAEITNGLLEVDDDEFPVTNGIVEEDSEDDEEASDGSDDEEELEGEEELDENDVNHDDVESEDEDSEVEAVHQPPTKRTRNSKRR
ncbi:Uu.00g065580.m01.CDS01 [Anthostomella pinea]|uniref:Uu.00g065580.m01.CDS01 n=1 Tax=Anthostomella pinea TaxID=933095 RepID=A0AAI8VV01_9PEZI|nr:Uu.00g065580.m01.CDS01 [Anthostomella pinea]